MTSKFDSSDEEWSDIYTRIKARVEKSSRKKETKHRENLSDICSKLNRMSIGIVTPKASKIKKEELISTVKKLFTSRKSINKPNIDTGIVEDDSIVRTGRKKKIFIDSGDESSGDASANDSTESEPGKLFNVNSSCGTEEEEESSANNSYIDRSAVEVDPTDESDCSESNKYIHSTTKSSEQSNVNPTGPNDGNVEKSAAFDTFCEREKSDKADEDDTIHESMKSDNEKSLLFVKKKKANYVILSSSDEENDEAQEEPQTSSLLRRSNVCEDQTSLFVSKKKTNKVVLTSSDENENRAQKKIHPKLMPKTSSTRERKPIVNIHANAGPSNSLTENKPSKQFNEYRNVIFSSDDEWGQILKPKKFVMKKKMLNKPSTSMADQNAKKVVAKLISPTNSNVARTPTCKAVVKPELKTPKLNNDNGMPTEEWLKFVSPERRKLDQIKITSPLARNPLTPMQENVKTSTPKKNLIPFQSPLPKYAMFSKYSPIVDQESVLRKLGVDFDINEKPSQKLWVSNKMLTNLMYKLDQGLFNSTLKNHQVEITWSGRLTSAAGITHYKTKLLMVECDIKLSRPILKLRPAKSLVETLIHEMIHAYLAVTRDPGSKGHGPTFKHHMKRINQMTNLDITVYHSYHDEVDHYKNQNVWRCTGACRTLRDFEYGYVRRAINRPPGPHEFWWTKHAAICHGTFERVYDHPWKSTLKV